MIDPPDVIGPRLKALRLACGHRWQKDFAKEIGVEKNTYNPWETGKRELTFEGALLIRKRFKVPLDYLFFGEMIEEIPGRILKRLQDAA
jgi:transcriptional regulator with XRE-family HTH domain